MNTGQELFRQAMNALYAFENWSHQNEALMDACVGEAKPNHRAEFLRVKAGQARKALTECSSLDPKYQEPEVFVPDRITVKAQEITERYYTGRTALGEPEEMCGDVGDILVRYFAGEMDEETAYAKLLGCEKNYLNWWGAK